MVNNEMYYLAKFQAEDKSTKVIDEDGMFALVAATTHLAGASQSAPADADVKPEVPLPSAVSAKPSQAPAAAAGASGAAGPAQPPLSLSGPKGRWC
jgi:hypothetical protein